MLSIIRNHSFIVIFCIVSIIMGLLFIFNLAEEEQAPSMMGNQQNVYAEQAQNSQGLIIKGEQELE